MGMGLKIAGIVFVVMLVITGTFYWYYTDTQARMAVLHENNARLETAVAISEETVSVLQQSNQQKDATITETNERLASARRENQELRDKLSEHELGYLASEKPGLVEPIINRATDKVNRCFELLTGAELTENERNAKDGNEFNSECPWLYDDFIGR